MNSYSFIVTDEYFFESREAVVGMPCRDGPPGVRLCLIEQVLAFRRPLSAVRHGVTLFLRFSLAGRKIANESMPGIGREQSRKVYRSIWPTLGRRTSTTPNGCTLDEPSKVAAGPCDLPRAALRHVCGDAGQSN
jgi:hypothetical protein